MSFTNVYSRAANNEAWYPLILNVKGFNKVLRDFDMPVKCAVKYKDKGNIRFEGFRTWPERIVEEMNLERFGYGYDHTHQWADLCAALSRHTEPFEMDCSPDENRFPNLPEYVPFDKEPFFFRGIFRNGHGKVLRYQFSLTTTYKEYETESTHNVSYPHNGKKHD